MIKKFSLAIALPVLFAARITHGGEQLSDKQPSPPAPPNDRWSLSLAVPGWMPGVEGTIGINGRNSEVDMGFEDLFNKIDMVWATRAEASKGRFGVMGELIYLSASDSLGVGGPVHKVDVRLDEYLADFSLRWRVMEGERGYVDVLAGVRYTNLYQHVHLQSDGDGIRQASQEFVDRVSALIRDRLIEILSNDDFRNALSDAVADDVGAELDEAEETLGDDPSRQNLAVGPLAGHHPMRVAQALEEVVQEEEAQLRAEVDALQVRGAARIAEVRRRVDAAKARLQKRVARELQKNLNRSFSRGDDWWDPYVGLRARYNFSPAVYIVGRADIGGFGVGSDLMWQAEAALGLQLTRSIHAEIGYRALGLNYDHDGLTYDTITHGAQVTTGIEF